MQENNNRKKINIALQGGGSHGAFSWGVLDRILEENFEIEGISGTSAGALNAAALCYGLAQGGRKAAQSSLNQLWKSVSEMCLLNPIRRSAIDILTGNWNLDHSPSVFWAQLYSNISSPYQINPLNLKPLEDLIKSVIDIEAIKKGSTNIYIGTTNVQTGRARIFTSADISIDALLASCCLPMIFHAPVIDGEPYWDGGFTGNPAIWPFAYDSSRCRDVILVQINPLIRKGTPQTPAEIANRVREISFNSSLMSEMRAFAFVSKLIREGYMNQKGEHEYKDMIMHRIEAEETMRELGTASKMNGEGSFLQHLHDLGYNSASRWLEKNQGSIGVRSTVDIAALYL